MRCKGYIGLQESLEFQEGLFVKGDMINLVKVDPTGIQAILNRILRKIRIMFLAGKALFLSSGDYPAILNQTRGAVVIKR